ncbi:globin domain-containing protein [Flindersiella endophytica]
MVTLFEQLGGRPGLTATVDEFCLRALADPALSRYVHDLDPAVVKPQLYTFLSATLGGPATNGGHPPIARLREHHVLPAEIPSIHVDNALGQLAEALRARGVSEDLIGLVITELLPVKDELLGAGLRPA